ncbi:anti-sigma factor family protein [Geodermatophilus sp. SYSU D00758]
MSELPREEHRALREQLGVYALGHGTPEERAAVRAHLDGCAGCRAELAPLLPLAARLDGVDPDRLDETPTPPPGLGAAVLARIAEERRASRRRPVTRRRLATAGAAAAVAASAFGVGWLARPVPPPPPLEAVAVEVLEEGVQASADVIPHTWGVEVRLSGEGFTAGEAHRVWVTDEAGAEVPAGGFIGVGPDQLDCNLNAFVLREDAVGFTVVDAAGDVVLTSRF